MAEEHRLTATELLQYFLSRYRVEAGAEAGADGAEAMPTPEPIVAAGERSEAEPGGD